MVNRLPQRLAVILVIAAVPVFDKAHAHPKDHCFRLSGTVVNALRGPYQAAKIRLTLTSIARQDEFILLPDFDGRVVEIRLPRHSHPEERVVAFEGILTAPQEERADILFAPPADIPEPLHQLLRKFGRLRLHPKQSETISFAFSPELPDKRANSWFAASGRYEVRVGLFTHGEPSPLQFRSEPFAVELPEPAAPDRDLATLFADRPELARVLMAPYIRSRGVPEPSPQVELEAILTKYPQSSYADYIRFTLAQLIIGGMDKAGIDYDAWSLSPWNPHAEPPATKTVSNANGRRAQELLRAIDFKSFPFAARALMLRMVLSENDDERRQVRKLLELHCYDDVVWLDYLNRTPTREEQQLLRQGKTVIRGPRPKQ